MYSELNGAFNNATDDNVVSAIDYLKLDWFNIFNRYNNNPPAPRVVTYSSGSEYTIGMFILHFTIING